MAGPEAVRHSHIRGGSRDIFHSVRCLKSIGDVPLCVREVAFKNCKRCHTNRSHCDPVSLSKGYRRFDNKINIGIGSCTFQRASNGVRGVIPGGPGKIL